MQYRGDNSVSKASNINRRIDKVNFEKIHPQLRLLVEENNVVEQEPEDEKSLRDEMYENMPNNGFINYTLFVNNSTQGNNNTHRLPRGSDMFVDTMNQMPNQMRQPMQHPRRQRCNPQPAPVAHDTLCPVYDDIELVHPGRSGDRIE